MQPRNFKTATQRRGLSALTRLLWATPAVVLKKVRWETGKAAHFLTGNMIEKEMYQPWHGRMRTPEKATGIWEEGRKRENVTGSPEKARAQMRTPKEAAHQKAGGKRKPPHFAEAKTHNLLR